MLKSFTKEFFGAFYKKNLPDYQDLLIAIKFAPQKRNFATL
jgi:hypothetical protein